MSASKGVRGVPMLTVIGHQMGVGYLAGPLYLDQTYSLAGGLAAAWWVALGLLALLAARPGSIERSIIQIAALRICFGQRKKHP